MKKARVSDVIDRQTFRRHLVRSDVPGFVFFGCHLASLGVTGWLVSLSLNTWWLPLAWFLHGTVLVHLFAPLHEATHYTAFRTKWLNDTVAWFCGLVIILSPTFFRYEHKAHHVHTQHDENDPEIIRLPKTLRGYLWYLSTIPYWTLLVHGMVDHARGKFSETDKGFLDEARRREVMHRARLMWLFYLLVALVSFVTGSWAALTHWLIPRLIGEPWMRVIRMAEHVGLPLVPNFLENTRTTKVMWPLRVLNWNMAFHTAHHFAPGVPFHRLPQFHAAIEPHIAHIGENYVEVHGDLVRKIVEDRQPATTGAD
ncbi:MAG: fatty acid desaturase [Geminicoccaceae bacterium]